jgi:competence protein ComEC
MTRGIPPLLPWQPCLLAAVAGILALGHPEAALAGFLLLTLFPRPAPRRPRTFHLVLAFLTGLGAAHLALPTPPATIPAWVADGRPQALVGRVVEVEARPEGRLACLLAAVRTDGADQEQPPLPGRLGLTIDAPAFRPLPGDLLAVTARLRPTRGFSNPGGTDFAFLRRLEGVFFRAYVRGNKEGGITRLKESADGLATTRESLRRLTEEALTPPPDATAADRAGRAMVLALIFGELSDFSTQDLDLVRRASLTHTLALSGMNISYVAILGFALVWLAGRVWPRLFLGLPRPYLALLVTAPLAVGYCWLGASSPSLYRAVCMFAGCGLLFFFGRRLPLFDGLFLALAGMLALSPLIAFDARLQLSALAVAGIGLFLQPVATLAARWRLPRALRLPLLSILGILWTSLCAEAAVLPVLARIFGEWNCNPWINVAWLPVLGFIVTPLALLGVAVLPLTALSAAGTALLLAAAWLCQGLMRALAWLDARGLLLSTPVLRPAWPEMLGCFGLLAGLALVVAGRKRPLAALVVSLGLLVGPAAWRGLTDGRDSVGLTVLDVGQGQAVAIDLPGGRRLLVDGGGLFGAFDVGRSVVGPVLTDGRPPRLEAVMASHPHTDHIKGLVYLLQHFAVGRYWDNGGVPEGALAAPIGQAVADRAIPHAALAAGDRLDLGHGLALAVLHPGQADDLSGNNGSLILRLTWNGRGLAILPGDAERGVLRRMADSGTPLGAEVLVLPHHGSSSSLSRRFHAAVAPRIAIASCGDNGHYPSAKVVQSLALLGCPTYATRRHGAVTVRFDGPQAPARVTVTVPPPDAITP